MTPQPIAVSVKTAAGLMDCSESTIREAITSGDLSAFRLGRAIRIKVVDLDAWADEQVRVYSEDDR
jgi:excisionase family DNA binding protein